MADSCPRICRIAAASIRTWLAEPDSRLELSEDDRYHYASLAARLDDATDLTDLDTQQDLCEAWNFCTTF